MLTSHSCFEFSNSLSTYTQGYFATTPYETFVYDMSSFGSVTVMVFVPSFGSLQIIVSAIMTSSSNCEKGNMFQLFLGNDGTIAGESALEHITGVRHFGFNGEPKLGLGWNLITLGEGGNTELLRFAKHMD